jgi:hypothetical protein
MPDLEDDDVIPSLANSAGSAGLKVSTSPNSFEEFNNKLIFAEINSQSLEVETSFEIFEESEGFEYSTLVFCFYEADASRNRENLYITRYEIDLSTLKYDQANQAFSWNWKTSEYAFFGKGGWTGVRTYGDSLL